jgi:uracil phosphoribosyltransferase
MVEEIGQPGQPEQRDSVAEAVAEARERILARKKLIRQLSPEEIGRGLRELRRVIFERKEKGEAFHPLSDKELALLESAIEKYVSEGRLTTVERINSDSSYQVLRHDFISGKSEISSREFREASFEIADNLFRRLLKEHQPDSSRTVILLPWRAGLVFGKPALAKGFKKFWHFSVKRDEETLGAKTYYERIPSDLDRESAPDNIQVVIADPMLATGNTIASAIEHLKEFGVFEKNIIIVAVIAAPEGVDHILSRFPEVRILVDSLDEKLNKDGYILPGLGDFGDKFFEGIGKEWIEDLVNRGILSQQDKTALYKRLGFAEKQ